MELIRVSRRSPVHRLRTWMASLFRPQSSTIAWELEGLLVVPAKGETYDFIVDATGTWTGNGIRRAVLNRRIDKYETEALRRLQATTRSVARQFSPQEPGPAEHAMNNALKGGWRYDDVRFEAAVEVNVDEDLREYLLASANARIDLENDAAFGRRQTELLDELVPRWQEVLTKVGRDIEAFHASRLADTNGQFAESVSEIIEEGRKRSEELLVLLDNSVRAYKDVDLYEFTTSYDSALTAFMKYMGIPTALEGKEEQPAAEHVNGHREV